MAEDNKDNKIVLWGILVGAIVIPILILLSGFLEIGFAIILPILAVVGIIGSIISAIFD